MSEKNDTTTNDQEMIVSLLAYLDGQCRPGYRNLVKALVAERDALRVEAQNAKTYWRERAERRDAEQRNEADRDLRERLVCAALPVVIADFYNCSPNKRYDLAWHIQSAVDAADAAIAAMRKGEADGK